MMMPCLEILMYISCFRACIYQKKTIYHGKLEKKDLGLPNSSTTIPYTQESSKGNASSQCYIVMCMKVLRQYSYRDIVMYCIIRCSAIYGCFQIRLRIGQFWLQTKALNKALVPMHWGWTKAHSRALTRALIT